MDNSLTALHTFFASGTSSVENKYETIEKSLSPYKIHPSTTTAESNPEGASNSRHVNVSIRKQLELQTATEAKIQKLLQAGSPLCSTLDQSRAGATSTPLSFSSSSSTSHYAQISPMRGVGIPRATPTYFQEISRSAEKSRSPIRRSLSPPANPALLQPKGLLFKSKPENNYLLNNNSQSAIGLNNLGGEGITSNGKWRLDKSDALNGNISKSDPKLTEASSSPPSHFYNKNKKASSNSAHSTPQKMVYPVYLRPEQNIPDVFANTKFKPIKGGGRNQGPAAYHKQRVTEKVKSDLENTRISRDDIVVTVRSAQV